MNIYAFISYGLDYSRNLFTCLTWTVYNAAAMLLTRSSGTSHLPPIPSSLHWLPVRFRIHFKVLVFTYRPLHGQASLTCSPLISPLGHLGRLNQGLCNRVFSRSVMLFFTVCDAIAYVLLLFLYFLKYMANITFVTLFVTFICERYFIKLTLLTYFGRRRFK